MLMRSEADFKEKHGVCMGPHAGVNGNRKQNGPKHEKRLSNAGVDYYLTVCPLQSRLQHIYHWQPYARVDLNPGRTVDPRVRFVSLPSRQRIFYVIIV
jgi:hypothetical protein